MYSHTKEPWKVQYGEVVAERDGKTFTVTKAYRESDCPISPVERDENMTRIALCKNALEGVSNKSLKDESIANTLINALYYLRLYRAVLPETEQPTPLDLLIKHIGKILAQ